MWTLSAAQLTKDSTQYKKSSSERSAIVSYNGQPEQN